MARYIIANRRAGKFNTTEKLASRASMANVLGSSFMAGASIIQENQPPRETARHGALFEAEPAEMAAKISSLPDDVIVEPEILHYTDVTRPMDFLGVPRDSLDGPVVFGDTRTLKVTVRGSTRPLYGTQVYLYLRAIGGGGREMTKITDKQGRANFEFSTYYTPSAIVAVPAADHWPMVLRGPLKEITISCPPLPPAAKNLGWWHDRLAISKMNKSRGRGIRVGVIDTGIGPHPYLNHVTDIGAFIEGDADSKGGADAHSHGSHVCGIIGCRPKDDNEYAGIASGVSLFSARVFPKEGGANQLDIANAIDAQSRDQRADLINMSLGAATGSDVERDAILDALERGTLCICAAGNSNGPVEYPAAFRETVAVSAIGLLGWGPAGSMPSTRLPLAPERFGDENLYHASFSCFGREIVCAGPGVGFISTVPERHGLAKPYASMGGTSMASPAACAALASVLSRSKLYKTLPRNQARADVARRLLRQSCQSIGLDSKYEGQGMPQA